eukprot:scaffold2392_cov72-Phaeocystis_antarctica.AAC.4
MWWSVTERRHRDERRGTVARVRPVRVQFMSSLQAARVIVHGTIALGGETKRARFANNRALGAVLSLLTRLATEAVRGVVARSTDHALAAAQEWLVRAGRAFKTPGPVAIARPIGSRPIGSL